ncbi:glycosyltransferase [bacterium]|nr:glycosyltransferase [bacterium]
MPRQIIREQLGLPLDKRLLLFVGRIEPLKGVDTILQALALLRDQQPHALEEVYLLIIGGDPNDARDPEMVNAAPIDEHFAPRRAGVLFRGKRAGAACPVLCGGGCGTCAVGL